MASCVDGFQKAFSISIFLINIDLVIFVMIYNLNFKESVLSRKEWKNCIVLI